MRTDRLARRLGVAFVVVSMTFATAMWSAPGAAADPQVRADVVLRSKGFILLAQDGGVFTFDVPFAGAPASDPAHCPNVGCRSIAMTPSGQGYWVLDNDTGAVYPFGTAGFYGDPATSLAHSEPALIPRFLQILPTSDGKGYWVYGEESGLGVMMAFGNAVSRPFFGNTFSSYPWGTGNPPFNGHPVGMAFTPDDKGYWEVWSDGGVYAYGNAQFYGSMGGVHLTREIIGMTPTADGKGYWLVASDGGVFAFGDAEFAGSTGGIHLAAPIVGMVRNVNGPGYYLAAADGGIFGFGGAGWLGSIPAGDIKLHSPITAIGTKRAVTG